MDSVDIALSLDDDDDGNDAGDLILDGGLSSSREVAVDPPPPAPARTPKRKRKKAYVISTKKPADAPKRFRSSFIFFSMEKHLEIKEQMKLSDGTKVGNITKAVSEAWRALTKEERDKYEEMARRDKERYYLETANYTPPPGMALTPKRPRDPDAPKRPMSAYLSFANARRAAVKTQYPDCSNGEISKLLSAAWKDAPEEIKQTFREEEQQKWAAYKKGMKAMRVKRRKNRVDWAASKSNDYTEDDFDGVENDFEVQLGLPGMDSSGNPNPDEMMAASALRGVRGGPQLTSMGTDSGQNYGAWFSGLSGMNSGTGGLGGDPAASSTNGSFNQFDTASFPYNQFGNYSIGANSHQALVMAQLRGASSHYDPRYPGLFPTPDLQPNLTQLASLAGSQQNNASPQMARNPSLNSSTSHGRIDPDLHDNSSGNMTPF